MTTPHEDLAAELKRCREALENAKFAFFRMRHRNTLQNEALETICAALRPQDPPRVKHTRDCDKILKGPLHPCDCGAEPTPPAEYVSTISPTGVDSSPPPTPPAGERTWRCPLCQSAGLADAGNGWQRCSCGVVFLLSDESWALTAPRQGDDE